MKYFFLLIPLMLGACIKLKSDPARNTGSVNGSVSTSPTPQNSGSVNPPSSVSPVTQTQNDCPSGPVLLDDFVYSGGGAIASAMAVDASDNIYIIGRGWAANMTAIHTLIRKSIDHGASWATIFDDTNTYLTDIKIDPSGNIFTAARTMNLSTSPPSYMGWIIRKSTDGGLSWVTLDEFDPGLTFYLIQLATKGSLIYAIGENGTDSLIRKSADGGSTWSNEVVPATSFLTGLILNAQALPILFGGASETGGTQWTAWDLSTGQVLDQFSTGPGLSSTALAGGVSPTGDSYLVGFANSSSDTQWIVRTSADGIKWDTRDDFSYSAGYYSEARHIAFAPSQVPYVMGSARLQTNDYHWLVRSPVENNWKTVVDLPLPVNDTAFEIDSASLAYVSAGVAFYDSSGNFQQYRWQTFGFCAP